MFGIFYIPLSIIFFPITEFIALEPMFNPRFAKLLASPFPVCLLLRFLYSFLILIPALACWPSWTLLFSLFLIFCLGPIVLALVTLMFPGSCFLLILSYLETKDMPLCKFTATETGLRRRTILSLISSFAFYDQKLFLRKVLLLHLELVQQQMLKVLVESLCLVVFFFYIFFPPPMYHTPFFTDCLPLILTNHHRFDWSYMFYVLK